MATPLDTRLVPRVYALIERVGRNITFHTVSYTYNPATSTGAEANDVQDRTRKATPPFPAVDAYVPNDTTTTDRLAFYIAAQGLAFTPVKGMRVVIDTRTYTVLSIEPIRTGDLIALWQIVVG